MKLLLDIGNTRAKWAWLAAGTLERAGEVVHRGRELDHVLASLPLGEPAPAAVLAASVAAPDLTGAVADAVRRSWGLTMRLAETERAACGVRCGYAEPRQLGVDRWLAMLGARHRHPSALCVVDAGTAVTIDLLRSDGEHEGGLIVAGLALMQAALRRDTQRIEPASRLAPAPAAAAAASMGRDTAACVRNGALLAIVCLVRHCAREAGADGPPATLVLTGGDAPALIPALADLAFEHRPLLVLEGLAVRHGGE